jgi:hypothetical protein
MIKETIGQRLLRQAADHIGRDELAIRLKASASLVDAWMHDLATLPDRKFSLLADVLHNLAAHVCPSDLKPQ